jgi:hypothetical protein
MATSTNSNVQTTTAAAARDTELMALLEQVVQMTQALAANPELLNSSSFQSLISSLNANRDALMNWLANNLTRP